MNDCQNNKFNSEFYDLSAFGHKPPMDKMQRAIKNDERIFYLAMYFKTCGMTKKAEHEKVMDCFSEFKTRIMRGCFTLDQLQNDVFDKFGLVK